jgi:hypothetical protein
MTQKHTGGNRRPHGGRSLSMQRCDGCIRLEIELIQ